MASSFASQLRTIAQNSTHEFDLRARRAAHAESLLFPRETAVRQDFETIHAICAEGFQELCSLDAAFAEFGRNLFSAQSIKTEREQMNKSENDALDSVLERCLTMLSGKLLLKPGVRCLEWLVRRFRVHVHNTAAVLLAVLPWHEMSIWRNVLSIVPKERCVAEWKFLAIYKDEALNVPRSAVVFAMTTNDGFFTRFNRFVVESAREGIVNTAMVKFWTGIVVEAFIGRLDATRSGRQEILRQRTEDLLLRILPLLSDGFELRGCPELTTACFTLAMVLAGRADLDDRVLDSLLQTVATAGSFPEIETHSVIVTLAVIVSQKQSKTVPRVALEVFMQLPNLEATLLGLSQGYQIRTLVEALVTSALLSLKKKNITGRLAFVEKVLRLGNLLTEQIVSSAAQVVLLRILELRSDDALETMARAGLIQMLQRLNEEHTLSLAISEASRRLDQDSTQLEALLGSTVAAIEAASPPATNAMDVDVPTPASTSVEELLGKIPSRTADTSSFLAKNSPHLYQQLVECFLACSGSSAALDRFASLPIWGSSSSKESLLFSLLIRIAVGPFTNIQKSAALQVLTSNLDRKSVAFDTQSLLPYAMVALSDSSQSVRRSASELVIAIDKATASEENVSEKFGINDLYEEPVLSDVKWITTGHTRKIISQAILPGLEECVFDASQAAGLLKSALNGQDMTRQIPSMTSQAELKKSLRHDLFDLLTSHAVATPLLQVKVQIINLIRDVGKVGTSTKSKALAPLFKAWLSNDEATAKTMADAEQLQLSAVDNAMVSIISSNDRDAIGHVLTLVEEDGLHRDDMIAALFSRVEQLWKGLRHETQVVSAQRLFELAFHDRSTIVRGAQGVLRGAHLTTDVLASLLDQSTTTILQLQGGEQQPKKRRRTSHGKDNLPPDAAKLVKAAAARLTLALELIDDSNLVTRPELLPALFDALATLKRLKQQGLGLPYLHNLCLSNINVVVEAQRVSPNKIDVSSIRADLVTDCIMSAENPQVQTTALLLAANLASFAPDRMLHNIMPIFTFMGQSMFSRDDEHSVYVVNQAIDKIIPTLVQGLRHQNKDLIRSTTSLLASFTAAFDHIPQHRRVATYARLLSRMGPDDFTFAILAMLAYRKGAHTSFDTFFRDLLGELSPVTQLTTFQRTMQLADDVLLPTSQLAEDMFGLTGTTSIEERQRLSQTIFKVGLRILKSRALKSQVSRLHRLDADTAESVRTEIDASFRVVLTTIKDRRKDGSNVIEEAKQCLDALLGLPSITELFSIIPQTLNNEEIDEDLKPQALRVLASQLSNNPLKDTKTRQAAMKLLGSLTAMLADNLQLAMKQAVIVCIDRLSEVYGRTDIETVVAAATVVAGDQCLGSGQRRLEIMSLLCLASMLEVLKEACIPVVPEMMPRLIEILRVATEYEKDGEELHNAAFALVSAVVAHVPFLVSDDDLQALLMLSSLSATKYDTMSALEARNEALSTMSTKVELASLLTALLGEDLNVVREHPEDAELEKLDVLNIAVETATKSEVVKNADAISQLLLAHLDQRSRLLSAGEAAEEEVVQAVSIIEEKIQAVSVQFIYKLNDTAFRPVFESWVDWGMNGYDLDSQLRATMLPLRRTSLLNLLAHFFETLKSIVTSYASYTIPLSNQILVDTASLASSKKSNQLSIDPALYSALLTMLRTTFAHDVDGFYNTPSHFEPIASPLVSQLKLTVSKPVRNLVNTEVIPTIVALAIATLDTPSHHQTISHGLVQLRHSSSAAVRLASIKTFAAITADEDVGDEFIANVIGIGSGEGEGARGIGGGGSVGEVMIYVNEMLEDDDEDVEREVRKWVQVVREKTGEDVFEV